MPRDSREKYEVLQWLMFQTGYVEPMLLQAHHFRQNVPEEVFYAIERCTNGATRPYRIMDRPTTRPTASPSGISLEDFPDLVRWYENTAACPMAECALEVGGELRPPITDLDGKAHNTLFGNRGRAEG